MSDGAALRYRQSATVFCYVGHSNANDKGGVGRKPTLCRRRGSHVMAGVIQSIRIFVQGYLIPHQMRQPQGDAGDERDDQQAHEQQAEVTEHGFDGDFYGDAADQAGAVEA
jgi:hypothetical protein